jgi:hypothetical protein
MHRCCSSHRRPCSTRHARFDLQVHATTTLPPAGKLWYSDLLRSCPFGIEHSEARVSVTAPFSSRTQADHRAALLAACHVELALAALHPGCRIPFRTQLEQLSADGSVFPLMVHAAASTYSFLGLQDGPGQPARPVSAMALAGALHWSAARCFRRDSNSVHASCHNGTGQACFACDVVGVVTLRSCCFQPVLGHGRLQDHACLAAPCGTCPGYAFEAHACTTTHTHFTSVIAAWLVCRVCSVPIARF